MMNVNKYANLPDIDTAQDVYETEEGYGPIAESSDDERNPPTVRQPKKEIDSSNLLSASEAGKRFKKAELDYSQPKPSFQTRLQALYAELADLESDIADPTNPPEGDVLRGLLDVKGRLDTLRNAKQKSRNAVNSLAVPSTSTPEAEKQATITNLPVLDRRVGALEALVGSSSTIIDHTTPLPAPLLPMLTRLNSQLTVLTQPRHLDAISRRLKLLLADMDRHQSSNPPPSTMALAPVLTRLSPLLPHIPHILTRLRTLSQLHTHAAQFASDMDSLEAEQRAVRTALQDLDQAVKRLEESFEQNQPVITQNLEGLQERLASVMATLEDIQKEY